MRIYGSAAVTAALLCVLALLARHATAHHSYAGFDPDQRAVFEGVLTEVLWANPHIIFTVDDGTTAMRVEWVTMAGANITHVTRERFHLGERMMVVASRHEDASINRMTAVKELALPAQGWRWIRPSGRSQEP